jgi:RNA polymerase II subunit A small phosphatase-like protein
MSSDNHVLSSLVTQVTKVPSYDDNNCTPETPTSETPYSTPGTPSSLLQKPNTATSSEPKKSSVLDFLIKSFKSCFVNTSAQPSPSAPVQPITVQPIVKYEKPRDKPVQDFLIPEQTEQMKGRKTLVLDLDETLVHSCFQPVNNADFVIPIVIEGTKHTVYVLKRPFVDDFLTEMGKLYEIVVFTASVSLYANPLLDLLDTNKVISHRLFREHCTFLDGSYVKDLSRLGRDLAHTIIIDNSKNCYKLQPENAMGSLTWLEDKRDAQLVRMIPYLVKIYQENQVYDTLRDWGRDEVQWNGGNQW